MLAPVVVAETCKRQRDKQFDCVHISPVSMPASGRAASLRMTLDEFLRWDDGTETHYELIDGFPVAMAPPAEAHRILPVRLVPWIDAALAGRRP